MRAWAVFVAALAAILAAYSQSPAQTPAADPVLQAMRDEVERSAKLTVSNLPPPYFVQYLIDQEDSFSVSASLGGLVTRRRAQFRAPQVQVRVGDYSFDNTNFGGGGFGGSRYDLGPFPTENAYPAMRRYLWLQTDMAYKSAVEALSRKRAAARGITQDEQINDFAHAEPVHYQVPLHGLTIDEDAWANRVRSLSALFTAFPDIVYSTIDLDAGAGGYYLVNSEGTEVRAAENVVDLRARAMAQAADGMSLADAVVFQASDAAHLPDEAELTRGITELANNVVALAHAPKGEEYIGPVLFEGMAGPQIFAEVLGRNLAIIRRPLGGGGRGGGSQTSELEGRVGAKVLPDSFDVVDDPLQKEWHGRPLFGSYDVDREGVVPKPLHLVEKGVLKGFLLTRQPVRGFEGSNGRARLPGPGGAMAAISNLFVSSSDTVPAADLKKKLIELVQARNRPYGIIVRKMDFPSAATGSTGLTGGVPATGSRPISAPILVYKVYPDGREELVRGLRFRGMNVRSLRDILATGDDSQAFEFLNQGAGFTAETCVVAPSVMIDELELFPPEQESPKPPVVPAPEMSR